MLKDLFNSLFYDKPIKQNKPKLGDIYSPKINITKKQLLEIYDDVGEFSEGYISVKRGELWGYVDNNGNLVIEPEYYAAKRFKYGLAFVARTYDKYGVIIDKKGNWLTMPFKVEPLLTSTFDKQYYENLYTKKDLVFERDNVDTNYAILHYISVSPFYSDDDSVTLIRVNFDTEIFQITSFENRNNWKDNYKTYNLEYKSINNEEYPDRPKI